MGVHKLESTILTLPHGGDKLINVVIHGVMRKFEFGSDVFLQNCLICLFLRCGCLEFARQMFDRMPERDVVSCNAMMAGYV